MKPIKFSYLDGRITIDPDLCNGRPTIRGKRITVQTVVEFLGAGESEEEKQANTARKSEIKIRNLILHTMRKRVSHIHFIHTMRSLTVKFLICSESEASPRFQHFRTGSPLFFSLFNTLLILNFE